ncbi:hypothetical protein ABZ234_19315 [Nocardiopsis sp. NPDC006198]|uniref:hypothetical protein n=1 Tax=Nocardiopsis sp. NPDC006198 TaxID=3154472 RepID=UPI0033A65549
MSNPTIATKLITLAKGIFGRKKPAAPAEPADTAAPSAAEAAGEKAAAGSPAPAAAPPEPAAAASADAEPEAGEKAPAAAPESAAAEPTAPEPAAAEPAEAPGAGATPAPESGTAEKKTTPEKAETPEEEGAQVRTEPVVPATEDVPEEAPAIAEELAAAEAHTTVASDEVLEKVRKEAAPAVEDLAVPTYDELTLPSVRARLRKLTIEQVRDLRAYEVAHGGRTEFIKMYDNRIAKLEAGA